VGHLTGKPDVHAASKIAKTCKVSAKAIRNIWKQGCDSLGVPNVDRRFKGGMIKHDRKAFAQNVMALEPKDRTAPQIAKLLKLPRSTAYTLCKEMGIKRGEASTESISNAGPNDTRTHNLMAGMSTESTSESGTANIQLVRRPIFRPLNVEQAEVVEIAMNGGLRTDRLAVNLPSNGSRFFRRSLQTLLPETELDSSTIDAFFEAMAQTHPNTCRGVHFFSTSFYTLLLDNLNEDLSKRGTFKYSLVRNWSANIQGKCVGINLQLAEIHKLQQNCTYPFPTVDSLM
jgi:hypothetical protein